MKVVEIHVRHSSCKLCLTQRSPSVNFHFVNYHFSDSLQSWSKPRMSYNDDVTLPSSFCHGKTISHDWLCTRHLHMPFKFANPLPKNAVQAHRKLMSSRLLQHYFPDLYANSNFKQWQQLLNQRKKTERIKHVVPPPAISKISRLWFFKKFQPCLPVHNLL